MPDEQANGTQAEPEAQPQAGTSDDKPQAGESISLDEAKKLRSEAKNLRTRLAAFEAAEEQRKQASLTEAERLKADREKLDRERQDLTVRERTIAVRDGLAAAATAEKLGLVASSATVIRLLDLNSVEFDDSGTPTNLGPLLKQLAKDEPALFEQRRRSGSADGGAGGNQSGHQDMNQLIRQAAGRG